MATLELPALYVDAVSLSDSAPRPLLANRDPGPGEVDISVDTDIALELIDTGADGIDRSATLVWVDDVLAFEGGATDEFKAPFTGVLSAATESADTLRIVLDPTVPFASEATVSVRVVSQTVGGLDQLDASYSFKIEDRTAPKLLSAQGTAPKIVRLEFDEPVLVASLTQVSFTFEAQSAPAVPLGVASAVADGAVVTLGLQTEMSPDVVYEVTTFGITDLHGNFIEVPTNTATFVGFRTPKPPERRFDLWQMLPKHNRRDDQTGDLENFIACLQDVTDLLLADIDRFANIFDLERAPEDFLDAILADLGNPFPFELDTLQKRRLASVLVEMYRQKGTAKGIRNAIRFFLGIEIKSIGAYNADTLALGESILGFDWLLGPSNKFAFYAFNVAVDRILTDVERSQIRAIVNYIKPAHTHFVELIEPIPPAQADHWELGLSELETQTYLH